MRTPLVALQFLTVFRLSKDLAVDPAGLGRAMRYFPLIGVLLGLVLVACWHLFSTLLPEGLVAGMLLVVLVLSSGGLHLDGFADTVDGLAGGKTAEERLRIMKDSATGALGVVALVLLLLIKYLAILDMPFDVKARALVAFPMIGRWAMVPLSLLPYARPAGGLGQAFAGGTKGAVAAATVFTAVVSVVLLGALSLVLMGVIGLMLYASARYFKKKAGGVTGDIFGFNCEVAEAVFLVLLIAMTNILALEE